MPKNQSAKPKLECNFCGNMFSWDDAKRHLVGGIDAVICDQCLFGSILIWATVNGIEVVERRIVELKNIVALRLAPCRPIKDNRKRAETYSDHPNKF